MENIDITIIKPENDLKEYRFIELPNKIQGILVSTKKYMEHFKLSSQKKSESTNHADPQGITEEPDNDEDYEDIEDDEEADKEDEDDDEEGEEDDEEEGEEDEGEEEEEGKKKKKKIGLASCSLVVHAGSFFDPKDIQGLAHLLEHVIFLGSKEFPEPDEYSKFMSRHGGYENAYTSMDATTYEFDIDNEHFGEGLYRLSRLIKEPMLRSEGIQKEVQAVNNEFDLAASDEDVQRFQTIQQSFKDTFPLNAFTWGNSKSLNKPEKELQQGVRNFYESYYHADKLKVCVQANYSLDDMEKFFRKAFEDFENKSGFQELKVAKEDIAEAKANFPSFNFLKTSNQIIKLTFTWPIDSLDHEHESYPLDLILEILNERSPGSLYFLLKEKQLITEFSAEMNTIDGQETPFIYLPWLILKLTDLGLKNLTSIINYVGQYINMMKRCPIPEYYIKEWITTNQLEFKYADEMAEDQLVNTLAHSLKNKIPNERLLEAGVYRVPRFFNEELYNSVLSDFSIQKARIDIQFPDINEELTNIKLVKEPLYEHEEPNFSVKWTSLDLIGLIGQEIATKLKEGYFEENLYSYPKRNDLIPENVDLKQIDEAYKYPKRLDDSTDNCQLWHSFDMNYKIPKACVNLIIFYRLMKSSTVNSFMELLEAYLKEEYSKTIGNNAVKAGYDVSMNKCEFCAFEVQIYGFSDKIVTLTDKILKFMQTCFQNVQEDMFQFVREKKVKQYESIIDDPETYAKRSSYRVYFDYSMMPEERKDFFSKCKFEDFKAFCCELLAPNSISNIKVHTHGNLSVEESKSIKAFIVQNIKTELWEEKLCKYLLSPTGKPLGGMRKISSHTEIPVAKLKSHLKDNKNNMVVFLVELDSDTVKNKLYLQVLNQIFNSEVFDDLRIKQDIGYISNSYSNIFQGLAVGLEIWVSSSKLGSTQITEKISDFIDRFLKDFLEKMTDSEFDMTVQSELSIKQKPFHNIQETGDHFWMEIKFNLNVMNRKEEEIKILKELKFTEFRDWVRSKFNEKKFFVIEIDINESADDPNPHVNVEKVKKLVAKFPDIHEYYLE